MSPSGPLRIAVWHNLPSGGGKRALYDHVRGLLAAGHEVEAWCPPSADQSFLPLGELVREHVVPLEEASSSTWCTLRELASDSSAAIEAMERHCLACAREIRAGDFDVLFANSCQRFRSTPIGRFVELPALLYLQEPYRWLYEALPDPPWAANHRSAGWWHRPGAVREELGRSVAMRLRAVQLREEVRNAAAFDRLLCNSLYSRESILRAYGLEAQVCYLGLDHRSFEGSVPGAARQPFFLTVGAAMAEKNVAFLVRALGLRADRSWPLVWVANVVDEELARQLEQLADEVGVRLELRRRVSEQELKTLYRSAGLFLYAPRLEPFGLAPLEAAASGLATAAVAEAGVRETVVDGRSGVLSAPSPAAFAALLDQLLASPERLRRLGRDARRLVEERWSLELGTGRLVEALEEVVAGGARRMPLQRTGLGRASERSRRRPEAPRAR